MPPHSDWRSRSAYDYIDGLQAPEIAWEFLRRNPDYRQEYRELSSTGRLDTDAGRAFAERWGSPFAADPSRTALEQIVAWSPSVDPSAILLDESPTRPAGNALTAGHLSDRTLFDRDRRRIVSAGDDRFCIDLPPTGDERPLAAIILLDDMTPDRLHAVLRFWAATTRGQPPPDNRLTQQRRVRLRQMLRAVDGHQTGCSYRDIAQILFPAHKIVPAAWRGDALRETTIRLVRDGLKHVRNGYRCLLRKTRRRC